MKEDEQKIHMLIIFKLVTTDVNFADPLAIVALPKC